MISAAENSEGPGLIFVSGLYIIVFPLNPPEVSPPPYISDGMELLYLSRATTIENFYLMVGFPSVFSVSSLHFITLLNTLASVVENNVFLMVLNPPQIVSLLGF